MRTLLLLLLVAWPAKAQVPPILQALRHNDWARAATLAAGNPDPVAARLVTFIRLLNPGQASPAELLAFTDETPGWPDQDVLARRYDEALASEPDDGVAAGLCARHAPAASPALLRCAEAWSLAGDRQRAIAAARQAWIGLQGDAVLEDEAVARWGASFTLADERARFDRLEPTDPAGAARQLSRLDPSTRALGTARLAFRNRDPDALATLTAVPAPLRADPRLLLAEARYLRRANALSAALALWRTALPAAEAATPRDRRALFWTERDALCRQLLTTNQDGDAYFLADDRALSPDQALDSAFLAGWIALRRLHDFSRARDRFQALAAGSHAAITQARAFYWLARAQADQSARLQSLARASAWPTTYYGQMAARAAGESDQSVQARIAALRDPVASQAEADALSGTELARAASILVSWADPRRAADFLRQLAQTRTAPGDRALVAGLALRLGLPDMAVHAARLAGRDGIVLAGSGWPAPVQPPPGPLPAALVLGVARQESSFDFSAASAAGAHGLMQLMPATAAQMARTLHAPAGPLTDPAINLRLGSAYLGTLLQKFGGVQAYAVAAYNAGPHRVQDFLATNGDAAASGDADALTDWIELIPFAETRNYVQRVLENEAVYTARYSPSLAGRGKG